MSTSNRVMNKNLFSDTFDFNETVHHFGNVHKVYLQSLLPQHFFESLQNK